MAHYREGLPRLTPVKITVLVTSDFGGAGSAAVRLTSQLAELGYEARCLVLRKTGSHARVEQISQGVPTLARKGIAYLRHRARQRLKAGSSSELLSKYEFYNEDETRSTVSVSELEAGLRGSQVVVVTWITHFTNFESLAVVQQRLGFATVYAPMDMSLFTGGCHYAWSCSGYKSQCGCCPALGSSDPGDASARNLAAKVEHLPADRGFVWSASAELDRQLARSRFGHFPRERVYLRVDETQFQPHGQRLELIDATGGETTLFVGALAPGMPRKGFEVLQAALAQLILAQPAYTQRLRFITAGNDPVRIHADVPQTDLGRLSYAQLAEAYRSVDYFVSASVQDSGPMMVSESLMSGTPVIAFRVGTAIDFLRDGNNGYDAGEAGDIAGLAQAIQRAVDASPAERAMLRESARHTAMQNFSVEPHQRALRQAVERALA